MTKLDQGSWKVNEALATEMAASAIAVPEAPLGEAAVVPDAGKPRRRIWPFGKRTDAPVA